MRESIAPCHRRHPAPTSKSSSLSTRQPLLESSGLDPTECELGLTRILLDGLQKIRSGAVIRDALAWVITCVRRLLGSLRRRGDRREILELATLPAPEEGEPWDGPGLLELWEWLEGISGQLERLLSPLEFRSLWAAEGAKTTREAAMKIPAIPKACRTLHLRVSAKISRRFFPESCLPSTSL
jgi:hypothetical protein